MESKLQKQVKKYFKKYKSYFYGNNIAKVTFTDQVKKDAGKLILVTATSPTPYGEGKTTVSIGLNDAMNDLKKSSIVCLREPSLGPVFGLKGGATGGGKTTVEPSEKINLHFTGDFHAITSCNNLIAACLDNIIYWGNSLNIDPNRIIFKRCLDMNDRSLRNIRIKNTYEYNAEFTITAASQIMAIFCLTKDQKDLLDRIENIIVAFTVNNKPILVRDLKIRNAIWACLKEAFDPNLVLTSGGNLASIHGGPFANIAHGCCSLRSINLARNNFDYVITEAGFGSDLGGQKFIDILCQNNFMVPQAAILVTTIRALKYHGGTTTNIEVENLVTLENGFNNNLIIHFENLKQFGINPIVTLNLFTTDSKKEIDLLEKLCKKHNINFVINSGFINGSKGCLDLAKMVIKTIKKHPVKNLNFTYLPSDSVRDKIKKIATKIYQASDVQFSDEAIKILDKIDYKNYDICMAKTPLSLTDDPKGVFKKHEHIIHVKRIEINSGSNFAIIYCNDIFLLPGLPKKPQAENF